MKTQTKPRAPRAVKPTKNDAPVMAPALTNLQAAIEATTGAQSSEGTALDPKVHTFKLEGEASITYTDADVALLTEAFEAQVNADDKAKGCAATLTRLFGRAWLDDTNKGEIYHKTVGTIRAWLWSTLPVCKVLRVATEEMKAANAGTIPPGNDAVALAQAKSAASSHIDRIVKAARVAQKMADQANSDGPLEAPATRAKSSTIKLIEDFAEKLDKRGQGKSADAPAAKAAGIVANQCAKGRTELFLTVMRCGARLMLSDDAMLTILRGMTGDEAAAILSRAKAQEAANERAKAES